METYTINLFTWLVTRRTQRALAVYLRGAR
jgi:hypothetical protein